MIWCNIMQYNAMQCDTIRYSKVWHYAIEYGLFQDLGAKLCSTIRYLGQYDTTQYNMIYCGLVQDNVIRCNMIWYDMTGYDMIWYDMTGCDTILSGTILSKPFMVWYNAIQYNMIWFYTVKLGAIITDIIQYLKQYNTNTTQLSAIIWFMMLES